jgi:tetratricopeptide (TPR) repeat protein
MDCSDLRGDLRASYEAAKRLAALHVNWHYRLGFHAMDLNRPLEAVAAFERYDPTLGRAARDWADSNFRNWARALHMIGDYEGELEVVRQGRELFPEAFRDREAFARIALGQIAEVQRMTEESLAGLGPGDSPVSILNTTALEFDAQGYPELAQELWEEILEWYESRPESERGSARIRRDRATFLLFLERDEEAIPLIEALAEETPGSLGITGRLGVLRARQGRTEEAQRISERLRQWEAPYLKGANTAWRANIAAALGDAEGAVQLLGQAHEQGWSFRSMPYRNPYLKPLRGHPAFEDFLRPRG